MKDHELRGLINELRDCAEKYHAHGCLRELISGIVTKHIESIEQKEPMAWKAKTDVYVKYITDTKYRKLSKTVQRWYEPICNNCNLEYRVRRDTVGAA
jgi:prolyl-tRNA synthetase